MDLYEEITRLIGELDVAVRRLRKSGTDLADAERKYKVCLRQEALKLRSEKNMPVTLINQIIYGVPEVANLRFDRDVKEAVYQANLESINSTKLKLRILENQLSREYSNAGRGNLWQIKKSIEELLICIRDYVLYVVAIKYKCITYDTDGLYGGRKTYMGNVIPLCKTHHDLVHTNKKKYITFLIDMIDKKLEEEKANG